MHGRTPKNPTKQAKNNTNKNNNNKKAKAGPQIPEQFLQNICARVKFEDSVCNVTYSKFRHGCFPVSF